VHVDASEIMIARTHGERDGRLQQRQVVQDDNDLGVERDTRADVELIAGHHHEVERRRVVDDPVELPQCVVEIRDEKNAHDARR
jgi:hypothetical protein